MKEWIVPLSAIAYWGGVWLRARLIKSRLGRLPNIGPGNAKEIILWAGWTLVVLAWGLTPELSGRFGESAVFFRTLPVSERALFSGLGFSAIASGLAGTGWCHAALGDAWRIGVRSGEKTALITNGPYRWMRHPIYFFQILILFGVFLLYASPFTLTVLVLHRFLVSFKMQDEERHLQDLHGLHYRDYCEKTGALWPKF